MTERSYQFGRRDRIVVWLANRVLRFASRRYRAVLKGTILLGLETAMREAGEGGG